MLDTLIALAAFYLQLPAKFFAIAAIARANSRHRADKGPAPAATR
jgi:hypothetical protein